MLPIIIAPSVLSADFACLGEEVRAVDAAGADWIHVDVMDGRFVPNITIGPVVLEAIRRSTAKPLNVHLMIVEPDRYLSDFADAGADHILVQGEPGSTIHLHRVLTQSTAVRAGTDRDAFTRAAAGQAMDDPTGRPEIAHGGKPPTAPSRRPHIVIVGAGFGGLSAATGLGRAAAVTVIDQRNHHLFQPLLYQVATAALSRADIAAPIRGIHSRQANTEVILGTVTGIDVAGRAVLIGERRIPYDQLVIATGARESYFGHDKWAAVTSGLKTIEDATTTRRRILIAFERAEACLDEIERRGQLTFVIIGGGPTGVELAGALAELAKAALACDFRHIDPTTARIVLIEAGPRLLPGFSASLSEAVARALARLGVEVRLGATVTSCGVDGAMLGDEQIASRTVIWAAGVAASPAAGWLGIEPGRGGRVPVGPDLTLPGHPEIFVIGDTAQVTGPRGPLPGVAPVAKQQGAYVARVIAARLAGKPPPGPFRYRDFGSLATIGRSAAVGDFGWLRLTGRLAWLVWGVAHIYFLIGFRNRMAVATDWLWSYLTYQRGARLITGHDNVTDAISIASKR